MNTLERDIQSPSDDNNTTTTNTNESPATATLQDNLTGQPLHQNEQEQEQEQANEEAQDQAPDEEAQDQEQPQEPTPTQPKSQQENSRENRDDTTVLPTTTSPSAADARAVAQAAQYANRAAAASRQKQKPPIHRWPSYAWDMSQVVRPIAATVVATVTTSTTPEPSLLEDTLTTTRPVAAAAGGDAFLFADHIATYYTAADDGASMTLAATSVKQNTTSSNNHHRRVPINILKLPWQHPFRHHESNRNPYKLPRALFAGLFLTTTLALLSAWDAQNHCVSNETDALMELLGYYFYQQIQTQNQDGGGGGSQDSSNDNNYNYNYYYYHYYEQQQEQQQQQQQQGNYYYNNNDYMQDNTEDAELSENAVLAVKATCRQMFQQVMLPVGLITCAASVVALGILRFHQQAYGSHNKRQRQQQQQQQERQKSATSTTTTTPALSIAESPPCFYSFYLPLLFTSGLILATWTVGIILVMLRPRANDTDNPYTSLAAVDSMGRVADNANLYYLSWMSEGIAILVFYQLLGAFVRQHCPPPLLSPKTTTATATTAAAAVATTKTTTATTTTSVMPSTIPANPSTVSTTSSAALYFPWHQHPAQCHSNNNSLTSTAGIGIVPQQPTNIPHITSKPNNSMDNSLVHSPTNQFYQEQYNRAVLHHQSSPLQHQGGSPAYTTTTTSPMGITTKHEHRYHSSRIKWYQTFYQLRIRTGIWVAALLCNMVVVASSAHLFHDVLLPAAQSLFDDDDYLQYNHHTNNNNWWDIVEDNRSYKSVCAILASHDSSLSQELCSRTFFSLLSGCAAILLCTTAIVLHFWTRRSAAADALYFEAYCGGDYYHELALQMMANKHHHLPLRTELLLSVVLSLWLGWNALRVSSVQGPAPRVGNLYYASWLGFILCLRICLGCVEEFFNIQDDEDHHHHHDHHHPEQKQKQPPKKGSATAETTNRNQKERSSYVAPNLSNVQEDGSADDQNNDTQQTRDADCYQPKDENSNNSKKANTKDSMERERAKRLRRYFFLGAFSAVCAGSAFDAANNQNYQLSLQEKYMMAAPTTAATLSAILFLLCLSKTSYQVVSQFWCGGVLSFVTFVIWLSNLILTMHSQESWAVNGVGEIEMANLYYFSWASMITAGLQMTSYVKEAFGLKSEDYMSIVWAAMAKVCFVILGAAGHIWHTISDQCGIVEIQNSAITFCSRTVLAMIVATTGLVIGSLVVFVRVMVPLRYFSARSRAHCEAVISIFLVLLFGAAAGMITGIGGPGQSVGDLYYSTWLAFWVSIGIFVSCYDQIKLEELESEHSEEFSPHSSVAADVGVMI